MPKSATFFWAVPLLAASLASPLLAAPADQIRARVSGYRALGSAFKTVNDALRSGEAQTPRVQQAAIQIRNAARQQYGWYAVGSGPNSGAKTAARAEIWSRAREFRTAQDALARQADAFQRAVSSGNPDMIRSEARKLGAACKGCHDSFRNARD